MAHPDLDRLLSFCLPFAQEMLKKHGEFHPFAVTVLTNGELNPIAIDSGEEHPSATKMIDQLTDLLKHNSAKGELQAAAICYDVRVTVQGDEKKDAITVFLEHSNGDVSRFIFRTARNCFVAINTKQLSGSKLHATC
jgi:hypothetical protein